MQVGCQTLLTIDAMKNASANGADYCFGLLDHEDGIEDIDK
jgi:hypothetical protein